MTVEQLKREVAKLSANDRVALAEWIQRSEDVLALQRDELIREIQLGVDEADRGELIDSDEGFAKLRAGLSANP